MTIALQLCAACGRVNYPAREICRNCLGDTLEFTEMPGAGRLLTQSTLHASGDAFFRERLPWRIGSVLLDNGAVVIVHLGPPDGNPSTLQMPVVEIGQSVELETAMLDGRPAFFARAVNQEA
jgi:uncharacterized OB-fold protein